MDNIHQGHQGHQGTQDHISKVFYGYHHSPESHQSSQWERPLTQWVTLITSRASCDAKNDTFKFYENRKKEVIVCLANDPFLMSSLVKKKKWKKFLKKESQITCHSVDPYSFHYILLWKARRNIYLFLYKEKAANHS